MDSVLILGRILFVLIFISSGFNHFAKLEAMTGYAKYKKLPAAKIGVLVSGLLFILAGAYIAFGFWVDLGAVILAVMMILTAFIFHAFWKESDETAKMNETIAFFKDLALSGAAMVIFALVHNGADFGPHIGNVLFF